MIVETLLVVLGVLLAAFWIGLALDYLPVQLGGSEMPRSARTLLLTVVGVAVVALVFKLLVGRLIRPLPDESLALLVERHHPKIDGRLVTAVQLSQPGRSGDSHSPEFLRSVHHQAADAVDSVDSARLFRTDLLVRKGLVVAPLLLAVLVFAVLNPNALATGFCRLSLLSDSPWPRQAELEMVGVELPQVVASEEELPPELLAFDGQLVRLPKGSSGTLRIRAKAVDKVVPPLCTVYYRSDDGTRGQSSMRRVGRIVDGYQAFILDGAPLANLSDSVTLSVRGLDARVDDYRIEAVEPPAITRFSVQVRYPDYLRTEASADIDLDIDYEAGLRIRQGSDVMLVAESSVPLGDVGAFLKNDSGQESGLSVDYSDDRTVARMRLDSLESATTIRLVPETTDGITAQAPYRYFMGVVLDRPPEIKLRLEGIGTAVTAAAMIPLSVTVVDDYSVEESSVSVATLKPAARDASTEGLSGDAGADVDNSVVHRKPLQVSREGQAAATMDLRELVQAGVLPDLVPGGSVSVYGEVRDGFDLGETHEIRSEVVRLEVVTDDQLLALLERRELGLRSRLEQTVDEVRLLREALVLLRRRSFADADPQAGADAETLQPALADEAAIRRENQVRRLRVQQNGLQAAKTADELTGIADALDSLLQEMINNRVDSVDRRQRIADGVRDPLRGVVAGPLATLILEIEQIETSVDDLPAARQKTDSAVETAETVLLQLTSILEKMLDLESYNEILELLRELIDDQKDIGEETRTEQKNRVLDLFK